MAFPNDITLANAQDGGTSTFSLIEAAQGVRADKTRDLSNPRTLTIKHGKQQVGKTFIDRHLIQFAETDMVNGEAVTTTVNLTIAMPRGNNSPKTTAKRLMGYIRDLMDENEPESTGALYGVLVNER